MKNYVTQLSLIVIAVVGLSLLMQYARPVDEQPKEYVVIYSEIQFGPKFDKFEAEVNKKLSEGWRTQGGVAVQGRGLMQAMVK